VSFRANVKVATETVAIWQKFLMFSSADFISSLDRRCFFIAT